MKRSAWGVAAAAALASLGIAVAPRPTPTISVAEISYRSALERLLYLDTESAGNLLRDALRADPSYLPALFQLHGLGDAGSRHLALTLDSLALRIRDPGLAHCVRTLARSRRGIAEPHPVIPRLSETGRLCHEYAVRQHARHSPPDADAYRRLVVEYGQVPAVGAVVTDSARRVTRYVGGASTDLSVQQHPIAAGNLIALQAADLHRVGRDGDAHRLEASVERDARWQYPGFRFAYYGGLIGHVDLLHPSRRIGPAQEAHALEMIDRSLSGQLREGAAGSAFVRLVVNARLGMWLLDRGRMSEAIMLLGIAARLADSVDHPGMRPPAHLKLGRALMKAGDRGAAHDELLAGYRAAVASEDPYHAAEAQHNLLHLHEVDADATAAVAAGTEFVRLASLAGLTAVRMMSQHDLGTFLRRRGRHVEAQPYIAGMLADIDSLTAEYVYAAEYHESVGELDRAQGYYSKGLDRDETPIRALAGLVRIARAKGDDEGAIDYAVRHDRLLASAAIPESEALLPGLLVSLGRIAEGRAAFMRSRERAAANGQMAAWASQSLSVAELDLKRGDLESAGALADSSAAAAARVADHATLIRARSVSGMATIAAGGPRAVAEAALRRSVADARRMADPRMEAEAEHMLGRGIASARWKEGLAHYDRAATLFDGIAADIGADVERAGFRSSHRRVYDDALGLIVTRAADPAAIPLFAEWSRRRKSRGFRGGADSARRTSFASPSPGEMLIDFVMLDEIVAAAVASPGRRRIVRLPMHADTVRALIQEIQSHTSARVGSQWDMTHAEFPLPAAHRLYRGLLEPLLQSAEPIARLVIIPDGALQLVPFDALPVDAAARGFVVDHYSLRFATDNSPAPRRGEVGGAVLVVAPQNGGVDGAGEIRAVRKHLARYPVRVLRDSAATEANLRAALDGATLIHFATHAVIRNATPAASALRLRRSGTDDGDLHAFEISGLRLTEALVVLGACETASGRVFEGEGVFSLSRSFFQAGARQAVASLWPIGNGTAAFMEAFYEALGRGRSTEDALRTAKLDARRRGQSPLVWAPFVLIDRFASSP